MYFVEYEYLNSPYTLVVEPYSDNIISESWLLIAQSKYFSNISRLPLPVTL
nr:MAG TPA: hypothetical protein [Caudoviricetes sp.]